MSFLPDPWLSDLRTHLRSFEGSESFMYLDGVNNLTCACGHLIPTLDACLALPWEDGDPAADYAAVKAAEPGMLAVRYAQLTGSRLAQTAIDQLLDTDIDEKTAELVAALPECGDWPAPVRQSLLDMAFNLGVHGLVTKFPHMLAAMRAGNWHSAAAESHRNGIGQARNDYTAALIESVIIKP